MTFWLSAAASYRLAPAELVASARAHAGAAMRRAGGLSQLALVGALDLVAPDCRDQPIAFFWQSTSGPRRETMALLDEMRDGDGEPLPYDFLATQPALAAVGLHSWLPGLNAASYTPLAAEGRAHWALIIGQALARIAQGHCRQALCAHLDAWEDYAEGHWLLLSAEPGDSPLARVAVSEPGAAGMPLDDRPDLPARLAADPRGILRAPAGVRLAVEFAPI
jgi:hypothetical protein